MKVSVVLPVFNDLELVKRSVNSILNQTYSNLELIIVDDCSNDGTYEFLLGLSKEDDRIKLFKTNVNSGSCTIPLNLGIQQAKGELIARMDSDDYSYPDRLAKQVQFLSENLNVGIVGTGAKFVTLNGEAIRNYVPPITHDQIVKNKYIKTILIHPTVMARKVIYDKIGVYNSDKYRCEDMDYWFRCLRNGVVIENLPEILLEYTVIAKGFSLKEFRSVSSTILKEAQLESKPFEGMQALAKYTLVKFFKYLKNK